MAELSETDKPKLKVKMQSVSDDNVQKIFLESYILSSVNSFIGWN